MNATRPPLSRRGLLGAAGGLGLAAVLGRAMSPTQSAGASLVRPIRDHRRPVSMAMHVHSCFSEGGSYATGGGGASMLAQLDQATKNNIDVIWWTDHDWRMQAYGYYAGIAFDGTQEDGGLQWFVQNEGSIEATDYGFIDDPHSPDEPGKAMRVTATGPEKYWGTSYLWAMAGNSFYSTNLSDTTLSIDVLGEQLGADAELIVELETSYRPATGGRPAGVYVLQYRVGAADARAVEAELTGVVTTRSTGDWQRLTMRPLDDIQSFWPDLVAKDSGLARLRFGVRARNGASATAVFDRLTIERTRDPLRWPIRTQGHLMRRLAKKYPRVTQFQSAEISMVRHLNVFMDNFELYPYPPTGKAPVLDGSAAAAEAVVQWYHDRGGLVQYNHPPTTTTELVETRALGADLIEIGAAEGSGTVIQDRINLYDVAARNAIFLTATSQIDDHDGRGWLDLDHLYLTSVWARSKDIADLLSALASGQAWWYHQRLWPTGRLDLSIGGRPAMGRVVQTPATSLTVGVTADNLPVDATVQVIVGVCDRNGATTSSLAKHPYPASAFVAGLLPFRLDCADGRYLRTEVYDTSGLLLGFSNPVWVIPADQHINVPCARRWDVDHLVGR